jgi:hypothetical protein
MKTTGTTTTTTLCWQPEATAAGHLVAPAVVARADEVVRAAVDERSFVRAGRTAWVRCGSGSLKLKGIGYWPGPGRPVNPPSARVFTRPRGHVGITEAVRLRLVDSAPAPLGGITMDRAMREFDAALSMSRLSAGGVRPVRVYRLTDPPLRFPEADSDGADGDGLAAVATFVPTGWPQRLDTLFLTPDRLSAADREFVDRVRQGRSLIDTVAELATGYGRALRVFNEAGLFRHSGTVDNWGVVPEDSRVFLTDLDSTRQLGTVGAARRPFEVLRDVSSGIFGLAAALMLPGVADDPAVAIDAMRRLVAGYFPEVPGDTVADAVGPMARYWTPLAVRSWAGHGTRPIGGDRAIWMDRDLSYCLLLCGLTTAYSAGDGHVRWGVADADALADAARDFLGPARFRRFEGFLAG